MDKIKVNGMLSSRVRQLSGQLPSAYCLRSALEVVFFLVCVQMKGKIALHFHFLNRKSTGKSYIFNFPLSEYKVCCLLTSVPVLCPGERALLRCRYDYSIPGEDEMQYPKPTSRVLGCGWNKRIGRQLSHWFRVILLPRGEEVWFFCCFFRQRLWRQVT